MASLAMVAPLLGLLLLRTVAAVAVSIPVAVRTEPGDCRYDGPITGTASLIAGQTIDAGTISYTITDAGSGVFTADVSVQVGGSGSCTVQPDAHVDLVSSLKSSGGELAPGEWPCASAPTSDTFAINCPVSGLKCCDTKYLYVHVVVTCDGVDETAFGGDTLCETRRWCRYVELAPPCGDCDCDTVNDRCFVKDMCPAFPTSCTFTPLCENLIPDACALPTECVGSQTKCTPAVCPGTTEPGVPDACITPMDCLGTIGEAHCQNEPVCDTTTDCTAPEACPAEKPCGGPICPLLANVPDLPSTVKTECTAKFTCEEPGKKFCNTEDVCSQSECIEAVPCDGTLGVDHCQTEPVCDKMTECTAPVPCDGETPCGGPICPLLAGVSDLPSTVKTACTAKFTCEEADKTFCNDEDVCTQGECVEATECPVEEQCVSEFKCPAPNLIADIPVDCVGKISCGLTECPDLMACPDACPTECPGVCPNCFIVNPNSDDPPCVPNASDDECDPCENGGDARCDEATNIPKFKCCPPTSTCKKTTIPGRLEQQQSTLPVSFVCSANCGGCDSVTPKNKSDGCTLFTEINLGSDGDPNTDDVLNVCDDLSVQ